MGSQASRAGRSIRFAGDFELDLSACELRHSGQAVKLERRPMDLLLYLVENRDRLVTREEIAERIWGRDVFVDTESGINTAVRKIRASLGDDPESPRFIQTIPGRGYRFIPPVEENGCPASEPILNGAAAEHPVTVRGSVGWRRPVVGVAAVLLVAAVSFLFLWRYRTPAQPPTGRIMLAVIPFENFTGDPSQEYFTDGVTEEIITELGRLDPQHLGVIARTSVMGYKGTKKKISDIGTDLGVHYVLEGSIRRETDRVRITAQLIQVKDQTHLWAHEYDYKLEDMLAIQSEIAQAVAQEIRLEVGNDMPASSRPRNLSTDEVQAYDLYLKGRYYWNMRTAGAFQRAIECFQQAIVKNPRYAPAHAGLADTYTLIGNYDYAPEAEVIPKARQEARRALELDEGLAEAHVSLALITEVYDWDWAAAEREYRRAIQLDPNYATAHHWYAELLAFQGRFDEALAEIERARELDPLSLIIGADHGAILYFARRYDDAIEQFQAVLRIDPSIARGQLIALCLVQKKDFQEAIRHIESGGRGDRGPWSFALEAYVYGAAGDRNRARAGLEKLQVAVQNEAVDPTPMFVMAYIGLGDNDRALATLEKGAKEHSNALTALKVDPIYDPLRSNPRFQQLLRQRGLSP